MFQETELLARTREFAEKILLDLPPKFLYHNYTHTERVVQYATDIGTYTGLSDKQMETLLIAAWAHDLGYSQGIDNHEERGKTLIKPFLKEQEGWEDKRIEKVLECIDATKVPQNPQGKLAEILADADLAHLAADDCIETSELLRQEFSLLFSKMGKTKWLKTSIAFFESHHYHTEYGQTVLAPLKQKNLEIIKQKLANKEQDKPEENQDNQSNDLNQASVKTAEKLQKAKRPERGVETMFRLTSANHFQLSAMADNKANIMISVNTIIISVIVSVLIRKLEEWPSLIIPTVMLTVSCLLATIFAILATRPNVTEGTFTKEAIENKTANLLFFGNFHQMALHDFEWGMKEMMNDADFLYSAMTRDIYFLGKVLGKKYKLLRLSYTIFMFGFVASVIAFGIAAMFFPEQ